MEVSSESMTPLSRFDGPLSAGMVFSYHFVIPLLKTLSTSPLRTWDEELTFQSGLLQHPNEVKFLLASFLQPFSPFKHRATV